MPIDEAQDLLIARDDGLWQVLQCGENDIALAQTPERKLADNKRMHQNFRRIEQVSEVAIRLAKMAHPNGSVDEDHADLCRRRGGAATSGSLPPSRANLRALSRSIRAFSASRTSADFSFNPVNAWAFRRRSSS